MSTILGCDSLEIELFALLFTLHLVLLGVVGQFLYSMVEGVQDHYLISHTTLLVVESPCYDPNSLYWLVYDEAGNS